MDELKNNAPELSKLKKENPFRTPENYFDDFSARFHMKLEAEKQVPISRKPRFIQLIKPALGLAASFAIIFMLVYVPLKTFIAKDANKVAKVSETTDSGFENLIDQIDELSFYALLTENDDEADFTNDDLAVYVSANFSDYEIYENLANEK
jgi:flagellar biosynthesis/type III secretory pathway M-ring protein FliF/YscJ